MKKIASTLPNMLLSLTLIAVLSAGILAWVKTITDEPIRLAEEKKQTEALQQVLPAFDKIKKKKDKDGKVYKAYQNNRWVGTAVECKGGGFSGDIVVMVGFDNKHQRRKRKSWKPWSNWSCRSNSRPHRHSYLINAITHCKCGPRAIR